MDTCTALEEIAFCEQQIAMLHGRQVRAMAGFVATAMSDPLYDLPEHAEASAFAEIAWVLEVSQRTSDSRSARRATWSSACLARWRPCVPARSRCPVRGSSSARP